MSDDEMRSVRMGGDAQHTEAAMRRLADKLKAELPPGMGFTLFVFDYGDGGHISYVSTAERRDMLATIRAWLRKAGE